MYFGLVIFYFTWLLICHVFFDDNVLFYFQHPVPSLATLQILNDMI